ncbi:hypothetical protein AOXY_G31697 [Acipenser oxyrinchus oxyrinchus]|uniref:Uncharacterized protein n=1 Tax=Acipenser oxyrinchus oxyrinchus TaxID=40147 RepID=A0AAD8CIG9_ACIOX|nr:hypothetical protein AOXY_G31697 [Acipenser oxyrinchus oxyrinchus]
MFEASESQRHDLPLTSSGIGHRYQPKPPCPAQRLRSSLPAVLPPHLQGSPLVSAFDEVANRFHTTSRTAHDRKRVVGPLAQPHHPRALPHWTLSSVGELEDRLRGRGLGGGVRWVSEFRDKFQGEAPPPPGTGVTLRARQPELYNHHRTEASQMVVATTLNRALAGRPFQASDRGVLALNEPYLSVTNKDFRKFHRDELYGPNKSFQTDFFSPTDRPLGGASRPGPTPFLEATPTGQCFPRLAPKTIPVPHTGLKPLSQDSYSSPEHPSKVQNRYCPVDTPWGLPRQGVVPEIMGIPKMYETEYRVYGSQRPIAV